LQQEPDGRAAKSGAVGDSPQKFSADLSKVVAAWPNLPAESKAAILAIANRAIPGDSISSPIKAIGF
jgi:hypothetical protein